MKNYSIMFLLNSIVFCFAGEMQLIPVSKYENNKENLKLLIQACKSGDNEQVGYLLKNNVSPNKLEDCDIPLHVAIQYGHQKIISLLLDYGADIEAQTVHIHNASLSGNDVFLGGVTPLFHALLNKNEVVFQQLISYGADFQKQIGGQTLLGLACIKQLKKSGFRLIECGVDIEETLKVFKKSSSSFAYLYEYRLIQWWKEFVLNKKNSIKVFLMVQKGINKLDSFCIQKVLKYVVGREDYTFEKNGVLLIKDARFLCYLKNNII